MNNLWALLVLAFPWAMSAEPWETMWPWSNQTVLASQYLFVLVLGLNGFVLFVLVGILYERELRRALWPPWPRVCMWFRRSKSGAKADDRRPLVRSVSTDSDPTPNQSAQASKGFWQVRPPSRSLSC